MGTRVVLVSLLSICAARVASAASFPYEQDHLTAENINDVLSERLPKQSRIQGADVADYLSTFLFSSVDVTSDHSTEANYDLRGPDNCKIFPGDATWPSKWLWTGLKLATLGGLIQPMPMSHVCYANGTDGPDEAACDSLAEDWNTAKFMYALIVPIRFKYLLTFIQKR